MKAVTYKGPKKMSVEQIPDPKIEDSRDAIIKVTTAAICGSDLHMYEGRTGAKPGLVMGHEIMGIVHKIGDDVKLIKKGDRVVLPFNIGCGMCKNCIKGLTNSCLIVNPKGVGAGYGYVGMGPQNGGQAEYVRVPYADFNALKLPGEPFDKFEDDFVLLADILPTGWHSLTLANFQPGGKVVIYGAGPVGLLAAESAFMRGATEVFVVDRYTDRLKLAKKIGATPINFDTSSSVEQIKNILKNEKYEKQAMEGGEDKLTGILYGVDAVGYQAMNENNPAQEEPEQAIDCLAELVDAGGAIGIIGVFFPEDPKGVDEKAKEGRYSIPLGKLWNKAITVGTGQTPVKKYNHELRDLIISGEAHPSFIVSHHISIDDAPEAYAKFDQRGNGYTKVLIQFK